MSRVEIDQALRPELGAGERLLWSGQPAQGLRLRPSDALMIPFSLMWGGFAIFWERSVLATAAPGFFALWGIPFVLIGMYMIVGRFFADARLRRRTTYGLTDRRILIVSGLFSRTVRSLDLRSLPEINLRESGTRSGTITFGAPSGVASSWYAGTPWPGVADKQAPAFDLIEDARMVYDQVRSAQSGLLPTAGR